MRSIIIRNHIKSDLNKYQRIGIFVTTYSLMLYLLRSSRSEIKSTLFFFTESLASKINFSNLDSIIVTDSISKSKLGFMRLIYSGIVRLIISTKYRIIRKKEIYCQDHSYPFSSLLLNNCNYTLYEDGIANYNNTCLQPPKYNTVKKKIISSIYGSHINQPVYGSSKFAKRVILTGLMPVLPLLENKYELINPRELWLKKTNKGKDFILNILGLDYSDINIAITKKVLLLTQPSSEVLTEKELIEIYRKGISRYKDEEILIKTHPRNNIDFKRYFPSIAIIDKPFPVNLLYYMGCEFNYVLSIQSSAMYCVGEKTNIIELGKD